MRRIISYRDKLLLVNSAVDHCTTAVKGKHGCSLQKSLSREQVIHNFLDTQQRHRSSNQPIERTHQLKTITNSTTSTTVVKPFT